MFGLIIVFYLFNNPLFLNVRGFFGQSLARGQTIFLTMSFHVFDMFLYMYVCYNIQLSEEKATTTKWKEDHKAIVHELELLRHEHLVVSNKLAAEEQLVENLKVCSLSLCTPFT